MENLKEKINRFFGKENETLIGRMLLWGFSNEEITLAGKENLIEFLGEDESIVYKN